MSGARDALHRVDGDWRRYARVAVAAVLVVSFAWGGVQLADPLPKAPGADPVDLEKSPARIAHDAMVQTQRGNYVVERYRGNATSLRRTSRFRWDATDRQARGTYWYATDEPGVAVYASEAGSWERPLAPSASSGWEPSRPQTLRPGLFGSPSAVLEPDAGVSLVARNESAVVVRVNDAGAAALAAWDYENFTGRNPEGRATLTLVVDRDTGMLRRSRYRQSRLVGPEDNRTRRVDVTVNRFSRWGDVDVESPPGLPYTFDAVLYDLVDYCGGCEEDEA